MMETNTWENVFHQTDSQLNNLEFYTDEVRFLDKIMGDYFAKMLKQEKLPEIRKAMDDLHEINRKLREIKEELKNHQKEIVLLREKVFDESNQWFLEKNEKMNKDLSAFYLNYRDAKSETYNLVEHVLHQEKMKKLILA